jgi:hypothetical protein
VRSLTEALPLAATSADIGRVDRERDRHTDMRVCRIWSWFLRLEPPGGARTSGFAVGFAVAFAVGTPYADQLGFGVGCGVGSRPVCLWAPSIGLAALGF